VQSKPPYDGGYSTTAYGEFLEHGWSRPADEFFQHLAGLYLAVTTSLAKVREDQSGEITRKLIHQSLVRLWAELFWLDDDGFALYRPRIMRTCIEDPERYLDE
jgi:hypothetical protein